jgi:hypothetical protein
MVLAVRGFWQFLLGVFIKLSYLEPPVNGGAKVGHGAE